MKKYVFINVDNTVNSTADWGDERDLPIDYPIPAGCTVKMTDDDNINYNYTFDVDSNSYVLKPYVEPVVPGPTLEEQIITLQEQNTVAKSAIDYILMNY